MSKQMQAVKEVDVHVVDETFLDDVKTGNIADVIKQHAISSWGSDVRLLGLLKYLLFDKLPTQSIVHHLSLLSNSLR